MHANDNALTHSVHTRTLSQTSADRVSMHRVVNAIKAKYGLETLAFSDGPETEGGTNILILSDFLSSSIIIIRWSSSMTSPHDRLVVEYYFVS